MGITLGSIHLYTNRETVDMKQVNGIWQHASLILEGMFIRKLAMH